MFPGAFFPGPRTKELDGVAIGLSPSPVELQRFVDPPTKVRNSLSPRKTSSLLGVFCRSQSQVPAPLPLSESLPADSIDVCCTPDLVMTHHSRAKLNFYGPCRGKSCFLCKPFQGPYKLSSQFERDR